jgi:hypothetical protein
MSTIPLDLERRFEQRWAARFARPVVAGAPEKHELEKQRQQAATPRNRKRKTRRVEAPDLEACPGGVNAGRVLR